MKPEAQWDRRKALGNVLSHAANFSPYYKEQEWAHRLRAGEGVTFREIPITAKSLVRNRTAEFFSSFVPSPHGKVKMKPTSGSTGEPMEVRKTERHYQINSMENQRLQRGWGYGGHKRMLQFGLPMADHPSGQIVEQDVGNGGRQWTLYRTESRAAFEFMLRIAPTFVTSSPSLILSVLEHCEESSHVPPLKLISTRAEVVPEKLRDLVSKIPGCRLADFYGTVETGLIAGLCPLCGTYHPADRHLILELITDDGRPSGPGELGRVIVTPLFNRAMPLIRYETGDYAVRAPANSCTRSPYAITGIVGRETNLFKLPDGGKIVPRLPHRVAHELALRQFKLIQRTLTDIELLYIPRDDAAQITEAVAQDLIDRYMAPGFKVRCLRVSELPRAPSGKYLQHECLI